MASVTSGYSVTSSLGGGTGSLRKNLEWDTTADLRTDKHWTENDVEIQNQREAARKIIIENDNLSQMVIETYSNYFPREDPEGKPSKRNTVTSGGAIQSKLRSDMSLYCLCEKIKDAHISKDLLMHFYFYSFFNKTGPTKQQT